MTYPAWETLQTRSFARATARERARGLADNGRFRELLGPRDNVHSPHLPLLGELAQSDDGMVVGLARMGRRPVFLVSMEGGFCGGGIGEVNGAKMFGMIRLAVEAQARQAAGSEPEPALVISFDTGGVRLHEANAGLLAHAEIMDALQDARSKLAIIALCGGRLGAFGGMGFVTMTADAMIMNEQGRIGLTGPEVIEEEMGRDAFDAADKALVWRTTGARHRYLMRDCDFLVTDTIGAFRAQLRQVLAMPPTALRALRKIGSADLVRRAQKQVADAVRLQVQDATDLWRAFGNPDTDTLQELPLDEFLQTARRAPTS